MIVEEGLRWHIALGTRPISYLELLLQLSNLLDIFVFLIFHWFALSIQFELTQSKIDEKACLGVLVIQKVTGLDVPVHNSIIGEVLHGLQHAEHVMLYLFQVHLVQICQEWLTFLILENQAHLAFEAVSLN